MNDAQRRRPLFQTSSWTNGDLRAVAHSTGRSPLVQEARAELTRRRLDRRRNSPSLFALEIGERAAGFTTRRGRRRGESAGGRATDGDPID